MEAIKKTVDNHAPLTTKMKTKRDHNPWFNKDSQKLKTQRIDEKIWIKSEQQQDLLDYKDINSIFKKHLHYSKKKKNTYIIQNK